MMATFDDPRISDQQLLQRVTELRFRDTLSRTPTEAKVRMEEAGCPPANWAPLAMDEHLELLQKQRWLEQRLARRDGGVYRARQAGAAWSEIADALGLDVEGVRANFRVWVAGQRRLYEQIGIGLDPAAAAEADALLGETTAVA